MDHNSLHFLTVKECKVKKALHNSLMTITVVSSRFFSTMCTIFSKAAVSSASLFSIFANFLCKLTTLLKYKK